MELAYASFTRPVYESLQRIESPRKSVKSADMTELGAAADRLGAAFSGGDEEETVVGFKQNTPCRKKLTKVSDVFGTAAYDLASSATLPAE
jgi:hypothetical protein